MNTATIARAIADALQDMDANANGRDNLAYAASRAVRALADDMETNPRAFGSDLDEAYLQHCYMRRQAATSASVRDFWHRLAGSVRKAGTL